RVREEVDRSFCRRQAKPGDDDVKLFYGNAREGEVKIGFIGLGMMGSGMAANLQKAGHDLVVHDLRRAAAEPYLAKGAVWADSPRAVAEGSEVVFTSLPG